MNLKRLHLNLVRLDTVDSTNNYAANLCKLSKLVNGTTILTKRQNHGRGQRGATWHSEPDKNLIFSTVIYPNLPIKRIFYLNICASISLVKTLNDLGIQAKVKWPNDIYIENRKVAGILIENQLGGNLVQTSVIGVGLNVNQLNFPPDINATSLSLEKGIELKTFGDVKIKEVHFSQQFPNVVYNQSFEKSVDEIKIPTSDLQFNGRIQLTLEENGQLSKKEFLVGALVDLTDEPQDNGYRLAKLKSDKLALTVLTNQTK